MALSFVSDSMVRLPCYDGYTQFALWPSPQLVSREEIDYMDILIHFQNNSCYGLLDVNYIVSPIKTGQWVDIYYYPGYTYAAYRATENCQVRKVNPSNSSYLFTFQVPSVTIYDTRPMHLIYHSHEFHVMDLKVKSIRFRKHLSIYFSQSNAPAMRSALVL